MLLCVSFGLTNQVWNYFEFLCKTYFVFENFKGGCLKILSLGKLGLKLVFWKSIWSHTHAFYFLYSMLWGMFSKIIFFFSKMMFFQIFDWSNLFFNQSKFFFKFFVSFCLFQSIETDFRSIENHKWAFLKVRSWLFQNIFFKLLQTFLSLSLSLSLRLGKATQHFFVIFLSNVCKVFLSLSWYVHYTLSFSLIFYFTCIFSCFGGLFSNYA